MSETQIGTQLSNEKNLIKDMKKIYKKANRIYRGIKRIKTLKNLFLIMKLISRHKSRNKKKSLK